jgi:hypothetical protein
VPFATAPPRLTAPIPATVAHSVTSGLHAAPHEDVSLDFRTILSEQATVDEPLGESRKGSTAMSSPREAQAFVKPALWEAASVWPEAQALQSLARPTGTTNPDAERSSPDVSASSAPLPVLDAGGAEKSSIAASPGLAVANTQSALSAKRAGTSPTKNPSFPMPSFPPGSPAALPPGVLTLGPELQSQSTGQPKAPTYGPKPAQPAAHTDYAAATSSPAIAPLVDQGSRRVDVSDPSMAVDLPDLAPVATLDPSSSYPSPGHTASLNPSSSVIGPEATGSTALPVGQSAPNDLSASAARDESAATADTLPAFDAAHALPPSLAATSRAKFGVGPIKAADPRLSDGPLGADAPSSLHSLTPKVSLEGMETGYSAGTSPTPASAALGVGRSPASAADPYQVLDQGAPAAMLHAASNRVAVGVHDPTLGWLEINTHSTAGQVAAQLVTASNQSHASLAAQLPSITQYLADQHVKVGHVGVEQQMAGGDSSGRQEGGSGAPDGTNAARPAEFSGQQSIPSQSIWEEDFDAHPLSYISVRV